MIHSGFVDVPDFDTEEADVSDAYSVLMSKMDKIVLMLVREYGNKLAFKGGGLHAVKVIGRYGTSNDRYRL